MINRLIVTAAFLATATVLPLQAQQPVEAVLQPGDAVRITVWRNPELSGEFPLAADGSILHPLYRELRVIGLPYSRVEAEVRALLARYDAENPQFVIEPLLQVSVGGEVRQPNLYRLPPETTIAQAVALAGGATDRGRLDRVRLFRGGEEIRIDLTRPEAGLAQEPIRSGDQLYVDRKVSIWREYIAPGGSITAAIVTLIGVLTR